MSMPPKSEQSASISQAGSTAAAANLANNASGAGSNDLNGASNGQSTNGQFGQSQTTGQSGLDDQYRYSQGQQQAPPQQYPYYSYQPGYSQQFQHSYPYYQSNAANQAGTTAGQSTQLGAGYPSYNEYSRVNYAQGYAVPGYQNQLLPNAASATTGAQANGSTTTPTAGSVPLNTSASTQALPNPTGVPQGSTQQITTASASAVGQVQPLGSRPRVTTTMWEDEKTLCYQVDANGVSVVRRADNNMINGTKLLNVAHMTRGRRDGILKSEKVRDVVKIGSMHLKGVWIPFERALAMAQREGIVDLLYPLFVRDIKQVIQQGSTTQPNPAATSGPLGAAPASTASGAQWTGYQQPQHLQQSIPAPQPSGTQQNQQQPQQQYQTQAPHSSQAADGKPNLSQQPQQQYSQQIGSTPQPIQQGYYNGGSSYPYYPQYPYTNYSNGSNSANGTAQGATGNAANASTAATTATTPGASSSAGAGVATQNPYQYNYNYGYAPQYQTSQYEEKDTK